jgi:hypothetical protein
MKGRASVSYHLCAWGNDAASEVIPRRVNCWLKTIYKPDGHPNPTRNPTGSGSGLKFHPWVRVRV